MTEPTVVALAIGDAAGIGPELAARLLVERLALAPNGTNEPKGNASAGGSNEVFLVVGDRRLLELGAQQAYVELDLPEASAAVAKGVARPDRSCLLDLGNCDPDAVSVGQASAEGGRAALGNFRRALEAAQAGVADLVLFTPFNKHAMRLAEPGYVDEIGFVDRALQAERSGREFNVLDEVWNARVTSHVPLREVASTIDEERVFESLRLTEEVMRGAGFDRPRIGVAALNPHAGDGGNFGREDDEVIAPAVERARAHQIAAVGPVPSDTVFVRALKREFDAVLTMYHDQGQIAMKLIGFDRGVTLIAGYPFPIVTPAHGTAYDIAGRGVANPGATRAALDLGLKLARRAAAA